MQTSRIIEHGVSETRTTAGETPAPDDDCVRQSKSDSPDQIRTSALNNTSVYVVRIRKKATPNYWTKRAKEIKCVVADEVNPIEEAGIGVCTYDI